MPHLLLVAGTSHHKPATALRDALIVRGHEVIIVTAKTSPDILRQQLALTPTVIWLANAQTTVNQRIYLQFYAALKKHGAHITPVAVGNYDDTYIPSAEIKLTRDIDSVADQLHTIVAPAPQSNRHLLAGIVGLVVVLLLMVALAGLVMSNPSDDALPTLIALDVDSNIDNTADTILETDVATSTATITPQAETTVEAEATDEPVNAELTTEAESTQDVDITTTPTATTTPQTLFVDFSVDVPRGYAPLNVFVTNLSSGPIQAYQWDYETDGIVDSTVFEPSVITYNTPGVYTLTLTVVDSQNRQLQSQKIIEVFEVVTEQTTTSTGSTLASFLTSTSSGQVPLDVQFTNRTRGANLTYRWDFNGDGAFDYEGVSPPTYTYAQVGTYTPRLEVTSEDGAKTTTQAQINVYNSSPDDVIEQIYDTDSKADFTISPSSGVLPLRVEVSNLSVGTNNNYEWDFDGDGVVDSASAQPRNQRYATAGTYTITLTVKGFDKFGGAKISRAQTEVIVSPKITSVPTITAVADEPLGLIADFVASTYQGTAPLTVQFYNYSSGENATYQWDFDGDGTIDSTAYEPAFTFVTGGSYETILYVTDSTGTDSTSVDIEVTPAQVLASATPTHTPTATIGGTSNATFTFTPTFTATLKGVATTTPSSTVTLSSATQVTLTSTPTATVTLSPTVTFTPTYTLTPTPSPTLTPSLTNTATFTPTFTPTLTFTVTPSNTPTATATATPESTD